MFKRIQTTGGLKDSISVYAYTKDKAHKLIPHFSGLDRPFANTNRLSLRINHIPKGASTITIRMKHIKDEKVTISLSDPGLACNRPVAALEGSRQGDTIEAEPFKNSGYIIDVNQNVFEEEDKEKNCVNYPTADFDTYMACDDAFVRNFVSTMGLGGHIPIWATSKKLCQNF